MKEGAFASVRFKLIGKVILEDADMNLSDPSLLRCDAFVDGKLLG